MTTEGQLNITGRPSPSHTGIEDGSLPAILRAISNLSEDDYRELKAWLVEHDWDRWDKEIERDSESGALNFLADEVRNDKQDGLLTDLKGLSDSPFPLAGGRACPELAEGLGWGNDLVVG